MNYFTPEKFPSLTVYYYGTRGQKATFDDPGYDDEIEFMEIEVGDTRLDIDLECHLIETFGDDWSQEIKQLNFEEKEINKAEKRMGY